MLVTTTPRDDNPATELLLYGDESGAWPGSFCTCQALDPTTKTASFTMPVNAAGSAVLLQSQVNAGLDRNNRVDASLTRNFKCMLGKKRPGFIAHWLNTPLSPATRVVYSGPTTVSRRLSSGVDVTAPGSGFSSPGSQKQWSTFDRYGNGTADAALACERPFTWT